MHIDIRNFLSIGGVGDLKRNLVSAQPLNSNPSGPWIKFYESHCPLILELFVFVFRVSRRLDLRVSRRRALRAESVHS